MTDQPLTKPELCRFLGTSRTILDRLLAHGLPVASTSDNGRQAFNAAAVARWLLAKAETAGGGAGADRERTRLLAAQADLAELRLQRERGASVDAAAVCSAWARTFVAIRDTLRQTPMAMVDDVMVASVEGRPAVKAVLLATIDEALTRAAATPVVMDEADDDDEGEGEGQAA